jgi:hypothetical protein
MKRFLPVAVLVVGLVVVGVAQQPAEVRRLRHYLGIRAFIKGAWGQGGER